VEGSRGVAVGEDAGLVGVVRLSAVALFLLFCRPAVQELYPGFAVVQRPLCEVVIHAVNILYPSVVGLATEGACEQAQYVAGGEQQLQEACFQGQVNGACMTQDLRQVQLAAWQPLTQRGPPSAEPLRLTWHSWLQTGWLCCI
jgi:hypothetical protein